MTFSSNVRCFYDFRKPRVKLSLDGDIWSVMDKFDITYDLRHINFYKYMYAYETYTYRECKDALLDELEHNNFLNVTILR